MININNEKYDKYKGANKLYVSYVSLFSPTFTACFVFCRILLT
jgi:hypothetical protein